MISAPATTEELLQRCHALAGLTLGQIATLSNVSVPPNLQRDKGWVGQLLEQVLGATAGSKAEPDFPHLGIEM